MRPAGIFAKEMGIPIKAYILKAKVATAQNILTFSDFSISDIAYSLGFSTQSAFAAAFRRITSMTAPEETALIRLLASLPDELLTAARERDPSRVNKYLIAAAGAFHRFYTACRIRGAGEPYEGARAYLAARTRDILAAGLGIIRVDAPTHM